MCDAQPSRFRFFPTKWGKFEESGTDNIELGGYTPRNYIMGSHVLFLASFHSNDIAMSTFRCVQPSCDRTVKLLSSWWIRTSPLALLPLRITA
jgi:hypothetical protein